MSPENLTEFRRLKPYSPKPYSARFRAFLRNLVEAGPRTPQKSYAPQESLQCRPWSDDPTESIAMPCQKPGQCHQIFMTHVKFLPANWYRQSNAEFLRNYVSFSLRSCRSSSVIVFFFFAGDLAGNIGRDFFLTPPPNKGSKLSGKHFRAFFVRNFVAQKKYFVQNSLCRRATLM